MKNEKNVSKDANLADSTNIYESRKERVLQRITYYTSNNNNFIIKNVLRKRGFIITLRMNAEELEKLAVVVKLLKAPNTSEAIRGSIDIVYGLLSGAKNIDAGTVIIQNPVVNIVKSEVRAEAKADSRVDNRVDITNKVVIDMDSFNEVIQLLNETRKLINNWYRLNMIPLAAAKSASEKLKKIEELLRSSN